MDLDKIRDFEEEFGTNKVSVGSFLASHAESIQVLRDVERFTRQTRTELRQLEALVTTGVDLSATLVDLSDKLERFQRQTRNELREQTGLLTRMAEALERQSPREP